MEKIVYEVIKSITNSSGRFLLFMMRQVHRATANCLCLSPCSFVFVCVRTYPFPVVDNDMLISLSPSFPLSLCVPLIFLLAARGTCRLVSETAAGGAAADYYSADHFVFI